jgi:site-specific recombinase XerD
MQKNFNLLFFGKRKRSNPNEIFIFVRITVDGVRTEFSTGRDCPTAHWNAKASKRIGNSNDVKAFNMYLDTIRVNVYEAHRQLMINNETITAKTLRNKVQGKTDRPRMLMEIFREHNDRMQQLIHDEFSPATLERYKTSYSHTLEFMQYQYKISDIDIKNIDYAFICDYEFYLRTVRKCNNNTAVKYLKNFNKIIRICLKNGWLDRSPFVNYTAKVKEVNRVYLTETEINTMMEKQFSTERLNRIKDIFLFSCFTGLAYADVAALRKSDINYVMSGEKWILTKRQKTNSICNIPILPPAEYIISKYEDDPVCLNTGKLLPVASNQKTNAYLKEIAAICGIEKELTFHIARHTFATTVTLTNGVSIESVSKMLGHKNLRTTQHYAKIIDKKVGDDMRFLKDKFSAFSSQNTLQKVASK